MEFALFAGPYRARVRNNAMKKSKLVMVGNGMAGEIGRASCRERV